MRKQGGSTLYSGSSEAILWRQNSSDVMLALENQRRLWNKGVTRGSAEQRIDLAAVFILNPRGQVEGSGVERMLSGSGWGLDNTRAPL